MADSKPNRFIQLTRGFETLVDEDDYKQLTTKRWWAAKSRSNFYATYWDMTERKSVRLHNFIMSPPSGLVVDHINGNSLDNRRENLRICSVTENLLNSRFKKTSRFL